ncbi:MAG: peptidoglycan editing factor PgeF [Rhodobacteraceae bacterium]|nr:peptidoglycan editing factor PgeF [Paracoccaceae bacterium]
MIQPPLTHSLLASCRHGFFTRTGGVSEGSYASLNCGMNTNDDRDAIAANRARAVAVLGLPSAKLLTARQIHSATVQSVTHADTSTDLTADGLVTAESGLAIGVLTADCQPILLADTANGVIAAIHAGWRGTLAGVIEAGIAAMEAIGAQRKTIRAVIGPCISQSNYEVREDVYAAAMERAGWTESFFIRNARGRYQMDLPGIGLRLLQKEQIGGCMKLDHCTYDEEDLFFSWRRTTHERRSRCGLMLAAIAL